MPELYINFSERSRDKLRLPPGKTEVRARDLKLLDLGIPHQGPLLQGTLGQLVCSKPSAIITVLSDELIVIENCGVQDLKVCRGHGHQYRLKVGRFAYLTPGDQIYFALGYQPAQLCQSALERRPASDIEGQSAKRLRVEGRFCS